MPAGQKLKNLRNKRQITVREVEQASRRLAEAKGDKRFCISNGWLAQLENGDSEPSICKLFSLSVIYRVKFPDLLRLYDVDVEDIEQYEPVAGSQVTQLINKNGGALSAGSVAAFATALIPRPQGKHLSGDFGPETAFGYLGLSDFTMFPMIRPGALLKIDTSQNKLVNILWRNEYERPIFFIELRNGYACGWCELQGNQLLVIPHPSSPASVRRFTYPREADIVGRVSGYSTHCVDLDTPQVTRMKAMPAQLEVVK